MRRPLMPDLFTAPEQQTEDRTEVCICTIRRDGWMPYLEKAHKYDMRTLFAYLAKTEGRKRWGPIPADATPLVGNCGRPVIAMVDKLD